MLNIVLLLVALSIGQGPSLVIAAKASTVVVIDVFEEDGPNGRILADVTVGKTKARVGFTNYSSSDTGYLCGPMQIGHSKFDKATQERIADAIESFMCRRETERREDLAKRRAAYELRRRRFLGR